MQSCQPVSPCMVTCCSFTFISPSPQSPLPSFSLRNYVLMYDAKLVLISFFYFSGPQWDNKLCRLFGYSWWISTTDYQQPQLCFYLNIYHLKDWTMMFTSSMMLVFIALYSMVVTLRSSFTAYPSAPYIFFVFSLMWALVACKKWKFWPSNLHPTCLAPTVPYPSDFSCPLSSHPLFPCLQEWVY